MAGAPDAKDDRMSTRQRHDGGRQEDGRRHGTSCTGRTGGRLAVVLRAAAGPAHPSELAGEAEAVAAFRAAVAGTAPVQSSKLRSALARVLTVKAVIVLAVAGSAGVVAATTGLLPESWASPEPPAEHSTTAPTSAPASAPTERAADPDTPGLRTTPPTPTTQEEPSIARLCLEYLDRGRPGNTLKDPSFRPLIAAAGSKGKVADYCATHTPQSSNTDTNEGTSTATMAGPENAGRPESTGKPERQSTAPSETARDNSQTTGKREPENTRPSGKTGDSRQPTSPSARPVTPGSPAHGTAVPPDSPGGAGPPSQGG